MKTLDRFDRYAWYLGHNRRDSNRAYHRGQRMNYLYEAIYLILVIITLGCWIGMNRRNARIERRINKLQQTYNEIILQARIAARDRD